MDNPTRLIPVVLLGLFWLGVLSALITGRWRVRGLDARVIDRRESPALFWAVWTFLLVACATATYAFWPRML